MLNKLLEHKIRKDILRNNKNNNHRQYLRALYMEPKIKYWAGYHKKKLIFFGLVIVISWTYELHVSMINYLLSMRSPRQFMMHLLFGSEKVEATINQQNIVGWPFEDKTLSLLTKLYYQVDKELIFGVGRNYLFQVYSGLGLLQKPEEATSFWRAGGFHKVRNQMVSGVSYKQFITLYQDGFKKLAKQNPELTPQNYLQQFMALFIQKGPQIQAWQKQFNRLRYSEHLKNLLTDDDKKSEQISTLMRENLQISEQDVSKRLQSIGMKGMGIKDKWTYWKNRQVLMSVRQYTLHKKINLPIIDAIQRKQMEKKIKQIEKCMNEINSKKQSLEEQYKQIYEEELI